MTDPEFADATYVEPLLPGPGRAGHRARAPRRAAADARRPDRAEPRQGAARGRHARALRRRAHRRRLRRDRPRRGPRPLPPDDGRRRAEDAAQRDRDDGRRGAAPRSATSACRASSARRSRSAAGAAASRAPRRSTGAIVARGLAASPIGQVLLDQSVLGWGEFELEVMRDHNDNVVIVCSIENVDPMGVHTGDSVTVAPQQTLTDRLYQQLRDQAIAVIRAVGVETGGSNVQFAVNPETEEILVIEMNPRVSRSLGAGLEGDRLPDRQDRRPAGGRLRARGDPERHHAAHAGELRADDRLRRRQVAALRVREVPRRRPGADDAHEVGRRGDGDRAHLPAGVRQGDALAASSTASPAFDALDLDALLTALERPAADRYDVLLEAFRRGATVEEVHGAHAHRPVVPARAARARARPRRAVRRRALVQGGRHLRRRVRGAHAVLLLRLGAARRARGRARRPRPRS